MAAMPFDYNIYERALRGGQTVGHNLAMTRETLQWVALWCLAPMYVGDLWLVSRHLPSRAVSAWLQTLEAETCRAIGFPLPQTLGITYPDGRVVTAPVAMVVRDPYIAYWSRVATDQLVLGLWLALAMTALAACGLWYYFKYVGGKKIETRKVRGQTVASARDLVTQIEAFNLE